MSGFKDKNSTDQNGRQQRKVREPTLSKRGQIAFDYAVERNWFVFPVKAGRKQPPLVKWSEKATNDPNVIQKWWDRWPEANIGIAAGPSGLVVIDVDVKNGNNGIFELECLQAIHGELQPTFTATTPSGGLHLYFKGNVPSSNGKIAPGIDIKSEGAYVLAPGSVIKGNHHE